MINWYEPFIGCVPFDKIGMSKKKMAKFQNNIAFQNEFAKLWNEAISTERYEGFPDTVNVRLIPWAFLLRSPVLFRMGDNFLCLSGFPTGDYNVNGDPLRAYVYGFNGFYKEIPLFIPGAKDCPEVRKGWTQNASIEPQGVIGWDNEMRYPYINYIIEAAGRLSDNRRSQDVIANTLKSPILITAESEAVKRDVEKFLANRDDNIAAILAVNDAIAKDTVQVFDLKANPEFLTVLRAKYEWDNGVFRELFGINANTMTDKASGVSSLEVSSNDMMTSLNREKRLECHRKWCDDINEVFGLNTSVDLAEREVWNGYGQMEGSMGDDDPQRTDSEGGEGGAV
jgi:hypothetical protein|nr:MAG TPA_asm: upper collar protein [Caudoviricetes sp.]